VDSATFFVLLSTVKSDSMKPQKVKAGKPQEDAVITEDSQKMLGSGVEKLTVAPQLKTPAKVRRHMCPDRDSECSRNQTCCLSHWGDFRCCPHPKATCCQDGKHCCPHGTVCNIEEGKCDDNRVQTSVSPVPKALLGPLVEDPDPDIIVCPDPNYECSKGETCCKLEDGGWGCCRFEKATCCKDERHCCPENTICDLERSACVPKQADKSSRNEADERMIDSIVANSTVAGSQGCHGDGQLLCPDQNTCCLQGDTCCHQDIHPWMTCCKGEYATCCKGGQNCCPFGFNCYIKPDGSMGCQIQPQPPKSTVQDSRDID